MHCKNLRQKAEFLLKFCALKINNVFSKALNRNIYDLIKAACAFIIIAAALIGICGTAFNTKYSTLVSSGEVSKSNTNVAEANLAIVNLTTLGKISQCAVDFKQSQKAETQGVKTVAVEIKTNTANVKKIDNAKKSANVKPLAGNYSGDPFQYPQCVWYVWGRAKAVTGVSLKFKTDSGRSAKNWLNRIVQTNGISVVKNPDAIRANSIAVFSHGGDGNGHVVFIENVTTDKQGNPRKIVISESNWGSQYKPSQKVMSWSEFRDRSNGSLKGYIYL